MGRLLLLVAFLVLANGSLWAQEKQIDQRLSQKGWQELLFDNKKPNDYYAHNDGSIIVGTNESVSLLYKKVDVDLSQTPKLSWEWKVDKSVPPTDLRIKGQDDRSLALYVSFPFDYERASLWERFIRAFVVAFKGEETPGRVISYVWGGDYETGSIVESPYLKSAGAQIPLRKAKESGGLWFHETVDIARDYERIFGVPANQPYQIAISADSDDTKVPSLAWIKNIHFE